MAIFIGDSIRALAKFLNIDTQIIFSSDIQKDNALKGQKKILDICKTLGATEYINAIGGVELYAMDEFLMNSIQLHFIKSEYIAYRQFSDEFIPDLSIIDVMMFNEKENVIQFLDKYEIIG